MKNWDYRMSAEDFAGTESYNEESIDRFLARKYNEYYAEAEEYGTRYLSVSNALEDILADYLTTYMDYGDGPKFREFKKELSEFISRHHIVSALDWKGWAMAELRKYDC